MVQLITCSTCRRHVKTTDASCPFCRTPTRGESPLSLVGAAAFGVAVAILASNGSACGSSVTGGAGGADAGVDAAGGTGGTGGTTGGIGGMYGPPPPP